MSRSNLQKQSPKEIIIEGEMVLLLPEELPTSTTKEQYETSEKPEKVDTSEKEPILHNKADNRNKKQVTSATHNRHYFIVFCAASAYCMKYVFAGSISPIADVLKEEYNVSLAAVGLLSSAIFLLGLISVIPSGIILQHVSYHKMLFIAWIGLIVSILLFGFCESLIFGILLRGMAGMFGACTWLLVVGLGALYFGNNSISVISALTICYTRTICFAAVTVQAYIYQKYQNWRGMYFIMAIIGIIVLIAYIVTIHVFTSDTSPATDRTPDEDVTADVTSDDNGEVQEKEETAKRGNPFRNYLNWVNCAVAFVIYALIDGIFGLWFIPYLMIKFHFNRVKASVTVGSGPWSHGFGALIIGYLAAKYKKRKIFLYFGIISMSFIFAIVFLKDAPDFIIFVAIIMVGVGSGAYACLLFTLTHEYNSRTHCEDSAAGLVTAFCIGAPFVSQNLIGVLLDYHGSGVTNETEDYQFAFSIFLPTCIIMIAIATFFLKETNGKKL